MTLFASLTLTQVTLLHDILHREMLDARRGRYSRAEGTVLEEMYAEVFERAEEARSASTGTGDATNREVVGAVSQGPNTSPSTQQPVQEPRIKELEIFLEQMYEALRGKKIRDFDTNWRMTEQVIPPGLECLHAKDSAEISGSYRKIHLSDVLSAARELIGLYWKRKAERESGDVEMYKEAARKEILRCRHHYREEMRLRLALSNLVTDMERALSDGPYDAAHLLETKYFVEARELLSASTTLGSEEQGRRG